VQCPAGKCSAQPGWRVRRPEAAPGHEIGVRRDRGDRIDLEQRQPAHHAQQPGRPLAIQQLRAHGNAARVQAGELVDGHGSRLWDRSDRNPPPRSQAQA
jgi:hypothetical protein